MTKQGLDVQSEEKDRSGASNDFDTHAWQTGEEAYVCELQSANKLSVGGALVVDVCVLIQPMCQMCLTL
jgi:hypothetical protein